MNKELTEEHQKKNFIDTLGNLEEKLIPEVPVFNRSVDLVKFNLTSNSITAIEFKLYKWKKAINQVLQVSISFDYLEICVNEPKTEKTKELIIDECKNLGIGVYFFNDSTNQFQHSLMPIKINDVWEIQRTSIINYINGENVHA
jgi:hypothetical protein